ncbi:hypothetical protein Tco_1574797 [Tanacetum coccineum]
MAQGLWKAYLGLWPATSHNTSILPLSLTKFLPISYQRLLVFFNVNESAGESIVEKPTVETNEHKTVRKENGALIIKDWVSESKEEDLPKIKTVEMFNKPSFAKINFVKSIIQVNTVKGTRVNTARPKAVLSAIKGNKGNAVKDSAC